jgi:hypothetical protein
MTAVDDEMKLDKLYVDPARQRMGLAPGCSSGQFPTPWLPAARR